MKIGITGLSGFIGSHLKNYLSLKANIHMVAFQREYFGDEEALTSFVAECDTIVHLAAVNRHEDQQVLYETNVALAKKLIAACRRAETSPHILFSSSTQENNESLYGKSKKKARELLEEWANENNAIVTGLIIPNVFGPFGRPFYNSVVATFCYQIARGESPKIINDAELNLIYVNELVEDIYIQINSKNHGQISVEPRHKIRVSVLLETLLEYQNNYLKNNSFPDLSTPFGLALFNTFRCYIPKDHYPVSFVKHSDDRGTFVEIVRANTSGQSSYSTTKPGVTRGNHFHTRKAERFAVIKGKARISLRKMDTDEIIHYDIDGEEPAFVDMPIWYTHNITNTGKEELITMFWINEPYDQEDPDTYFIDV